MRINLDRRTGLVTVSIAGVSETLPRKSLMALLGVPNPRVKVSTILSAFGRQTAPERFRAWLLRRDVAKGTASKMEQVLRGLNAGEITPAEVRGKSLNWSYELIKKEVKK